MAELNETARAALRRAVLEERTELREAYQAVKEAQTALNLEQANFKRHRDRIVDLQEAAGDPIEIDPTFPEIT